MIIDEEKLQAIYTCLHLCDKPELSDYLNEFLQKINCEVNSNSESDDNLSYSSEGNSEENFGYSVDDSGLHSLR